MIKRVRNTLSSDQLLAARLADEARLLRAVSHPNVVRVLDHGIGHDGRPFLVMDRAHGTPLYDVITERGPLPLERLAAIASQLLAGLAAIHAAGIVHADLTSQQRAGRRGRHRHHHRLRARPRDVRRHRTPPTRSPAPRRTWHPR